MSDVLTATAASIVGVTLIVAALVLLARHRLDPDARPLAATMVVLGLAGIAFGLQPVTPVARELKVLFLLLSGFTGLRFAATIAPVPRWLVPGSSLAGAAALVVTIATDPPAAGPHLFAMTVVLLAWAPPVVFTCSILVERAHGVGSMQSFRLRAIAAGLMASVVAHAVWLAVSAFPFEPTFVLRAIVFSEIVVIGLVVGIAVPPRRIRVWLHRATAGAERDVLRALVALPEDGDLPASVLELAIELGGVAGGYLATVQGAVAVVGEDDLVVDAAVDVATERRIRLDGRRDVHVFPFPAGDERAIVGLEILRPTVTFGPDDARRVRRFLASAGPVVERARLHAELAEQRERQNAVLETVGTLGQGYLLVERGRVIDASPTIEDITGRPLDALRALSDVSLVVDGSDRELVRSLPTRDVATVCTTSVVRPDGRRQLVELAARALGGDTGRSLWLMRDVTSVAHALDRETRRSRQLHALTGLARSVAGVLDRDAVQRAIVAAGHEVLDATHVALLIRTADGRLDVQRSGPPSVAIDRQIPSAAVELAAGRRRDALVTHERGGVIGVRLVAGGALEGELLFSRDGADDAFDDIDRMVAENLAFLCAHGLSAARRYEGEVGARERVEASHDFQAGLLAVVAHDLRSPLHLVGGLAETLAAHRARLTADQQDDLLRRLREGVLRTQRLLENLLDVERDALGMLEVTLEPHGLGGFAREAAARLPEDVAHRVVVEGDGVTALIDAHRAERIVENLVVNAAKYAPPDTPITIRVWAEGDRGVLAVEDRGDGIPEHERQAVWEAFRRLPGSTRRAGVGLGLHVVAVLAQAQGADVSVDVSQEGGASFRVAFALHEPAGALATS